MSLEDKKTEGQKTEVGSLVVKSLAALAAVSFLFWPRSKPVSQKAQLKEASHTVARAENQTGRLEKA